MKSVLISIQPKWCELIASGKKTVEVRKTKPKLETPFKVYIYCTKDNSFAEKTLREFDKNGKAIYYKANKGKVIGEFVCDRIRCEKEVADGLVDVVLKSTSCIGYKELLQYANGNVLYSWHISDLVIYDEPKELSEFFYACKQPSGTDCSVCVDHRENSCKTITRPPQGWCYVEEVEQ